MSAHNSQIITEICRPLYIATHSKKHRVPPNRYIYLHRSNSWQLLTVTQKFALEQNFCVQASRYFVCTFHQVDKSTWIKMWFLQCSAANHVHIFVNRSDDSLIWECCSLGLQNKIPSLRNKVEPKQLHPQRFWKTVPPWRVEQFFPLIIMFRKCQGWRWVTYHETAPGVEPFWLHFFLSDICQNCSGGSKWTYLGL